jgi:hypothetical protein
MSKANALLLLLFLQFTTQLSKKLPLRIERKRDSIEFERSENIGQFFIMSFLLILNILNILGGLKAFYINAFSS